MQYLDIPGITGESVSDVNPNWNQKIQMHNFHYGVQQKTTQAVGSGLVAAGASMTPITFTKQMDKSTPYLFFKLCSGEPIPTMTIRVSQAGSAGGVYEVETIVLQNVIVTGYSTSGSRGDGALPTEYISLAVGGVNETYDWQVNGMSKGKVSHGFNFQTGVGSAAGGI